MIVRYLHTVHELRSRLAQPTREMAVLRELLTEQGCYTTRRTCGRRLKALPDTLPAQIGCLGRYLIDLIEPWTCCGRAVAIDKYRAASPRGCRIKSIGRRENLLTRPFKGNFDGHGQVPTKGSFAAQRFALGAIFVYQLALLYHFEHGLELCVGLKAFLKEA